MRHESGCQDAARRRRHVCALVKPRTSLSPREATPAAVATTPAARSCVWRRELGLRNNGLRRAYLGLIA
jgi:hypothetical protein